jgi:hypothetical protein
MSGDNKNYKKIEGVWNIGIGKVLLMLVTNVTNIPGINHIEHNKIFNVIEKKGKTRPW